MKAVKSRAVITKYVNKVKPLPDYAKKRIYQKNAKIHLNLNHDFDSNDSNQNIENIKGFNKSIQQLLKIIMMLYYIIKLQYYGNDVTKIFAKCSSNTY